MRQNTLGPNLQILSTFFLSSYLSLFLALHFYCWSIYPSYSYAISQRVFHSSAPKMNQDYSKTASETNLPAVPLVPPQCFIDQLNALIDSSDTFPQGPIPIVQRSINIIFNYFITASELLAGLSDQNDIQWVLEARPAVQDIHSCIGQIKDYLSLLMGILETVREELTSGKSSHSPGSSHPKMLSLGSCPPPTTKAASLSRSKRRKAAEYVTTEKLRSLADEIQSAIAQWKDLHSHTLALLDRIVIAAEWSEFHNVIMADIESEIDSCFVILLEIQSNQSNPDDQVNLGLLSQSICDSPGVGCKKLPYRTETERSNTFKFHLVQNKLGPLRASLDVLPMRFSMYERKATKVYPASIEALETRRDELLRRWQELTTEVETVSQAFDTESWPLILQSVCVEASHLLVLNEQSPSLDTARAICQCFEILDRADRDHILPSELVEQSQDLQNRWQKAKPTSIVSTDTPTKAPKCDAKEVNTGLHRASASSGSNYTTSCSSTFSSPNSNYSSNPSGFSHTYTDSTIFQSKYKQLQPPAYSKLSEPTPLESDSSQAHSESISQPKRYKLKLISVAVPMNSNSTMSEVHSLDIQTLAPVEYIQNENTTTTIGSAGQRWSVSSTSNPGFCPSNPSPTIHTVRATATTAHAGQSRIPVSTSRCSSRASLTSSEPPKQNKLVVRMHEPPTKRRVVSSSSTPDSTTNSHSIGDSGRPPCSRHRISTSSLSDYSSRPLFTSHIPIRSSISSLSQSSNHKSHWIDNHHDAILKLQSTQYTQEHKSQKDLANNANKRYSIDTPIRRLSTNSIGRPRSSLPVHKSFSECTSELHVRKRKSSLTQLETLHADRELPDRKRITSPTGRVGKYGLRLRKLSDMNI